MKSKKEVQLGMSSGKANHKLMKDIIWSFIQKTNSKCCHVCGGEMDRESYSIEHKVPWLDSESPVDMFFDMNNISFSHLKCNVGAARKPTRYDNRDEYAELVKKRNAESKKRNYTSEKRKAKYEKEKLKRNNIAPQ